MLKLETTFLQLRSHTASNGKTYHNADILTDKGAVAIGVGDEVLSKVAQLSQGAKVVFDCALRIWQGRVQGIYVTAVNQKAAN